MEPIQYPSVTALTEAERIEQIRKYLCQMADQINYNNDLLERRIKEITEQE